MKDGRTFLKVKIKSLTAESSIIRQETARAPKSIRSELSHHRRTEVRQAARSTGLAYAFIRGKSYRDCEAKALTPPDWKEVTRMVRKYGVRWQSPQPYAEFKAAEAEQEKRLAAWLAEATNQCQNESKPPSMPSPARSPMS